MKCFTLSFVLLAVAHLSVALSVPDLNGLVARQVNNNKTGKNGGNNNQNGGNNNQNGGNNNGGGNTDPQTSLTLDPSVIQTINGKGQAAGEADSLVSTNNFIGFCVGKTITNGLQVQGGSCNPTPMGDIPSVDNMPSVKFEFPPNGGNVQPDTPFTVSMNINGMQTGTFTNAANTYYAAPQQLNGAGQVIGHNHVVIELIPSLDSTQPTNPRVFAFFKGLNAAAANGKLTADVTKGLPAGTYRMSSITSAGNHQSVVMPVAQRGSVDDAVYFTVGGNANGNTGGQNGGNNNGQNGGNNNGQNNNGQNGGNNNGRNGVRNGRRYERRFFSWA
jgi:hypothetical protein